MTKIERKMLEAIIEFTILAKHGEQLVDTMTEFVEVGVDPDDVAMYATNACKEIFWGLADKLEAERGE